MSMQRPLVFLAAATAFALLNGCAQPGTGRFDLLIENGKIVDGTGNPWYYGDVGIVGDTIVEIGDLSGRAADRTIDAEGLVVGPGFIDMHTHVDDAFDRPGSSAILNYLIQGVTTVRPGADGSSSHRIAEIKARWEENGMGTNAALTVGFNVVRREVMGEDFLRSPTSGELEQMRSLVRQAMREGAWGISTGLEYEGLHIYATTEEVIQVTRPVAEFGGIYISHMRDEAAHLLDAIREIIRISEEVGVPVNVTHFKATGKKNWGLMKDAVQLINDARARGVTITADQYPFDQSAPIGFITDLIDVPQDMEPFAELRERRRNRDLSPEQRDPLRREFVEELQKALTDESRRERLRESTYEQREANPSSVARWGWHDFRIKVAVENAHLIDKNLLELVEEQGRDGFDIVADLVLNEPDILFASGSMSQNDTRLAMVQPWLMTSSDGGGFPIIEEGARPVRGHPRSFASQSILLRKFVREEKLLSLEDAVRKMTSLPAQFLGMRDRGLLLEGYVADIAIFDPDSIQDHATYADSRRYATGVKYVIVNGNLSVENGEFNGTLNGKVLLKN